MTEGVFNCLIDKKRSLAFKKTIYNAVNKRDVVVDMGTSLGILALFVKTQVTPTELAKKFGEILGIEGKV
jgi:predicted RNA methylase